MMLAGVAAMAPCLCLADDFGTWTSVAVEKKFSPKFAAALWGEYRTKDNASNTDRWVWEIRGDYKPIKHFTVTGSYMLLYDHNRGKSGEDQLGRYSAPAYFGIRHRFNVKLAASYQIDNVAIAVREVWQYTYRPEKSIPCNYDETGEPREMVVNGKGHNALRSMLTLTYKIPDSRFSPFVSAESFNSWTYTEGRYKAGTGFSIDKHNSVQLYYMLNDFAATPTRHTIGTAYKYSF